MTENQLDYNFLKRQGTGGHQEFSEGRYVIYPFERYEIKVLLGSNNEFIGIVEVKVNKSFLSHKQQLAMPHYHDVDKFYRDDE